MTPFCLPVSCVRCGSDVELLAATASRAGDLSVASVTCARCEMDFELTVRLRFQAISAAKLQRQADAKVVSKQRRRMVSA